MDVTKMLEADHRQVEDLFAKIERAKGNARQPMIDQLAMALRAHMKLEEEVVYPAMEPVTGEESVEEANVEHKLARKGLDEMLALAPDEPGFGAALDAVRAGISHHVKEEEGEIFPKLRKDKSVLEQMAIPFLHKRADLGMPTDAKALAASSSKEELLAEAQTVGIEGAPSMKKEELAEALAAKMS